VESEAPHLGLLLVLYSLLPCCGFSRASLATKAAAFLPEGLTRFGVEAGNPWLVVFLVKVQSRKKMGET
jgi:hypothetical protein